MNEPCCGNCPHFSETDVIPFYVGRCLLWKSPVETKEEVCDDYPVRKEWNKEVKRGKAV